MSAGSIGAWRATPTAAWWPRHDLGGIIAGVAGETGAEADGQVPRAATSVACRRHSRSGMLDTAGQRTSMYAAVVLYARD